MQLIVHVRDVRSYTAFSFSWSLKKKRTRYVLITAKTFSLACVWAIVGTGLLYSCCRYLSNSGSGAKQSRVGGRKGE